MRKSLASFLALAFLLVSILGYQNCSGFKYAATSEEGSSGSSGGYDTYVAPSSANQPAAATSGTPKVTQKRNGVVIATYNSIGEAFTRVHAFRTYETGDVYELDAAVYSGAENQPWIGPLAKDDADYNRGEDQFLIPKDIIIRGLTQNDTRPVLKMTDGGSGNTLGQAVVYLDRSENVTIENIDIDGGGEAGGWVGKAGLYLNGVKNFTLRNSRIINFHEANGVFGTGNNTGLITFENVETAFNGGGSGPEHNYYIGSSDTDDNFTIHWTGCYSHDAYYGHTLKSRAQNNIVEASHLKGKRVTGSDQGEAYLADFPNGGNITVRNTIFEKDYSGDSSNGVFITFAVEGQNFPDASSISITHNTFIAHSEVYDSQGHTLFPMSFYYPNIIPTNSSWPSNVPVKVEANLFAGFANSSSSGGTHEYRGTDPLTVNLSDFNSDLTLKSKSSSSLSAVGQLQHYAPLGSTLRTNSTYGGLD